MPANGRWDLIRCLKVNFDWDMSENIAWLVSVCFWCDSPQWSRASSFTRFLEHTQRRTTVFRTPLDEWFSSSERPLPDNTQHSQHTNIHAPDGIWTHNLSRRAAATFDSAASGTGRSAYISCINWGTDGRTETSKSFLLRSAERSSVLIKWQ